MLRHIIGKKASRIFLLFMAYSLMFPVHIFALPQGGTVVAGQAQIATPDARNMTINQATPKTIINWQKFGIAMPEAVRFMQPNASAWALNRVVGVDPSIINGLLSANGRIFVINPNGLLIGPTGQVNVNSFLASTLDIANEDFLAERFVFSQNIGQSLASIINQGRITAADGGSVSLFAPAVRNEGTIVANFGKVFLGAGEQVTLSFAGNDLIKFAVDESVKDKVLGPDGEPLADSVSNTGSISADGGEVVLSGRTAAGLVQSVVNNSGIIEARSLVNQGGVIKLEGDEENVTANSGTLDVSGLSSSPSPLAGEGQGEGAKGGIVYALGSKVGLFGYGKINASGDKGGGKVLIGGDFHGKNPEVQNADMTYVSPNASIKADAISDGDGGKVIVWSDDSTRFYGSISARGGENSGDGGFAEVSGRQHLSMTGHADLRAPNGTAGTLLLDPGTVNIVVGVIGDAGPDTFSDTYINDQLTLGSLAIATSGATGANGAAEDITFVDAPAITWANAGNALTLDAGRNITLGGTIIGAGALNLNFDILGAGGTLDLSGATTLTAAPITATGGTGNDIFRLTNAQFNAKPTVAGGGGTDAIHITDVTSTVPDVDFTNVTLVQTLFLEGAGAQTVTLAGFAEAAGVVTVNAAASSTSTIDAIAYSTGVTITGGTGADTITGGAGNDIITGGAGANTIVGGAGTDTIVETMDADFTLINTSLTFGVGNSDTMTPADIEVAILTGGASANAIDVSGWTGTRTASIFVTAGADTVTGTPTAANTTLIGTAAGDAYSITGVNVGIVNEIAGTTFTNVGHLVGGLGNDTFTLGTGVSTFTGSIAGGAGVNTLASTDTANTWAVTAADIGTLNTTTTFSAIANLTGGSSTDDFTFGAAGTLSGLIDGSAGADSVNYAAIVAPLTVTLDTNLVNVETLIGNAGTLVGANISNTWSITAANTGTVTDGDGLGTVSFSGIANLTGGTDTDAFTLSGVGNITGTITGGGVVTGNTLTGKDIASTWAINAANAGTLTDINGVNAFTGIDALVGGINTDVFTLAAGIMTFGGTIDGAGATNTLVTTDGANAWQVTGANAGTLNTTTIFSNIATLTGGTGTDTLTGLATANAFSITGANAVTTSGMSGSSMEALVGGAAADTFTLATGITTFNGSIDGAGLTDALVATDGTNAWQVTGANAGTLNTSTTFSNMETLTGGTGVDTFSISNGSGALTVNAGLGDDVINVSDLDDGNFSTFTSTLNINGDGGSDTINVGNASFGSGILTGSAITGLGSMTGQINYGTMETINITYLAGSDTFNVRGIASGVTATLSMGDGNDTINVGNAGNSLDDLLGTLVVNGEGQTTGDIININDQGDTTANTYGVAGATITRSGAGNITYGNIETINLYAGTGSDTIDITGSGAGNLRVEGNAGLNTINVHTNPLNISGALSLNNAALVNIDESITAGTSIAITNTSVVQIQATGNTISASNGPIDIQTGVGSIDLTDGGLLTIDGNGDAAVNLAALTDTGATNESLTVHSEGNVVITSANLGFGTLTVHVDSDGDGAATGTFGALTAGVVDVDGAGGNDTLTFNGLVTSSTGATSIDTAGTININAGITAATALDVNAATTVNIATGSTVQTTSGELDIQTGVTTLNITGADGTLLTIDGNGDANVLLAAITDTNNPNLTVNTEGGVNIVSAAMGTGTLAVHVDNDSDGLETGTFGALTAGVVDVDGTGSNDTLTFNGLVTSSAGATTIDTAGTININAGITAATTLDLNTATTVNIATGSTVQTTSGELDIQTGVTTLNITGADGTLLTIDGNGDANVLLAAITDTNNPNLTVNTEGGVNIVSAAMGTGTLAVHVDNDGDGTTTGTFGALTAGTVDVDGVGSNDTLTFNAAVTSTAGNVEIGPAGQVDLSNVMANELLSVSGTNIDLNGTTYTSSNNAITLTGPVDLDNGGTITLTSGAAAGDNITFTSTVDGGSVLNLVAGLGNVTLTGNAGAAAALTTFTVTSAAQSDLANVRAGNIDITSTNIDLNGTTYTATTDDIRFAGAVDLDNGGTITLTSGSGAGDDITFAGTVDGASGLNLVAGSGALTFNNAVGGSTSVGVLTVASAAGGVTANSTIRAASIGITNGGAVDLNGTVTAPGGFASAGTTFDNTDAAITTTNSNIIIDHAGNVIIGAALNSGSGSTDIDTGGTLNLNAGITTTTGNVTLDSTGLTTVAAAGNIMTGTGNVSFGVNKAGLLTTSGNVTTVGGTVTFDNATTLGDGILVSTEAGAGDILFNSSLTGTGAGLQTLGLTAGTGGVLFNGAVGTTQLGALTINSATGGVTANSTVSAASVGITNGGAVDLNGMVTAPGGFASTGATFDNTGATITTTNSNITINHTGNVIIGAALSSGSGNTGIDAAGTLGLNAGITTTTGNVTLDSTGLTAVAAAGDITTGTGSVGFGQYKAGLLVTSGDVTTTGGNVVYNNDTTLAGSIQVDTGGGAGNISFNGALTGTNAEGQTLGLTAGTGSILFNGDVGATPLGTLTVASASGVTSNGTMDATSMTITNGGAVDINGVVNLSGTFSSAGTTFDNTGGSITTNGTLTINHTGNVTIGAALNSSGGPVNIDSTGANVNLTAAGDINSAGGTVDIDSAAALTMTDGALINSGSGKIVLAAVNDITLGGLLTTNTTALAVKVTSTAGSIIDGGDTHLEVDAVDGNLEMNAAGTIGAGNPLEIRVATLTAHSGGALGIVESDAITLTDVDTVNGVIDIRSGGNMVATDVTSGGNQAITLNSSGNIDMTTVNAGSGPVSLTATGPINGGTFTGGSGTVNAPTAGLSSVVTANVSDLTVALTSQDASGVSGKFSAGPALTTAPPPESISAPGSVVIGNLFTYLTTQQQGGLRSIQSESASVVSQQIIEELLEDASKADFFMEPPLLVNIDVENIGLLEEVPEEEKLPEGCHRNPATGEIECEGDMDKNKGSETPGTQSKIMYPSMGNHGYMPTLLFDGNGGSVIPGLTFSEFGWEEALRTQG